MAACQIVDVHGGGGGRLGLFQGGEDPFPGPEVEFE